MTTNPYPTAKKRTRTQIQIRTQKTTANTKYKHENKHKHNKTTNINNKADTHINQIIKWKQIRIHNRERQLKQRRYSRKRASDK